MCSPYLGNIRLTVVAMTVFAIGETSNFGDDNCLPMHQLSDCRWLASGYEHILDYRVSGIFSFNSPRRRTNDKIFGVIRSDNGHGFMSPIISSAAKSSMLFQGCSVRCEVSRWWLIKARTCRSRLMTRSRSIDQRRKWRTSRCTYR